MTVEFNITETDYLQAFRLASRYSLKSIVIFVIFSVAFLTFAYIDSGSIAGRPLYIMLSLMVLYFTYVHIALPWMVRRAYRKYRAINKGFSKLTLDLQDDGLVLTTPDAKILVRWENMIKWKENEEFILIYITPGQYHIIPKSVREKGFDINKLSEILSQNIGKPV